MQPIRETYDLAWLTNVYAYMADPLWTALLVRVIASLPIGGPDGGGLLVTNHFDQDTRIAETPMAGEMGAILTLGGMTLVDEIRSPLDHSLPLIIARRTSASRWIDAACALLRQHGLT
ncbi:MAG: hypothetical protein HYV02_08300 [Deltaproteobacteria bacterium]|nr:hypothetical protein [Deltaproteobacteria bacterium]